MNWKMECQHCKRAKCYEYGLCFSCDEDVCKYKPFSYSATTSTSINQPTYIGNKAEAETKLKELQEI